MDYIGVPFRQLSRKLRIQRGSGRPDKVSERPFREGKDGMRRYLDSDEAPTLVTFDEYDRVDVAHMLATGVLTPWAPTGGG